MAIYSYKNGKWFDKRSGEEVTLPERGDSWGKGGFLLSSDYQGYTCPVTGTWIEGRAAHRENLKRHGCRILEKGEKEEARNTRERELERAIERTADAMVARYHNYFD